MQAVRDATAVGAGGFVDTPNQTSGHSKRTAGIHAEQLGQIVVTYRSPVGSSAAVAACWQNAYSYSRCG